MTDEPAAPAAEPVPADDTDAPDQVKTEPTPDAADETAEPDEISFLPVDRNIHPSDEALWQQRARAYDSQYAGPEHWRRVLNVLAATGSIPLALRIVGFSRHKFTLRRERYVEFGEAVQQALDYFNHATLERAAVARAVDGVLEPVYHKGLHVGYKRVYSDTLLIRLLEANDPEKFKPKMDVNSTTTVTVTGGLPPDEPIEEDLPTFDAGAPAVVAEPAKPEAVDPAAPGE